MKTILTSTLFIFTLSAYSQNFIAFQKESGPESNWVKVYNEGLTGYLDETGEEIIPPVYEEIGRFGECCSNMALVRKNGLYGLVDTYGNVIVEAQYEMIGRQDEYKPGWILVKREGLYGFIDCSGEEIVKPVYTEIQMEGNTLKVN
ncbi:WG repeat-containing protein [Flavobacterium sp. DGU11]|uniref:WG repeat-containing protein n=1 Tax=Flavobacterium arundinis TaxID=3139143 RepID=A0ABU9HZQ8_9FLAO